MTLRVEDLRGEARDAFRMWREVFHLSESAALAAVAQDGLVEQDGFDRAAASFANIFNLNEGAARVAARGRMSVSEAKEFWDSAGSSSTDIRDPHLRLASEALARMSDAEVDAMLIEEQARRRKAAKKTPNRRPFSRPPSATRRSS